MKILHISPCPIWDVTEKSGMPSIYWGLKGFVDKGHEVTYMFPGKQSRHYNYEGFWICEFRLWVPQISPRYIWIHRLFNKISALAFFIVTPIKGFILSRSFKPDVVYGHFHAAPVAWLLGRILGIPNITRIFGTFLFHYIHSFLGRLKNIEELITFKTPCHYMIITNDGTRGNDCAKILGVPEEKVKYWINGIDKTTYNPTSQSSLKERFKIPQSHKLIVAVTRLVKWKGVDRLIKALPRILQKFPEVTAVIVGDGDQRADLEQLVENLEVQKNVRFVGSVMHSEVPEFMNAGDIFVSLYDFGNMGNPLLEAICCGRCIVSLNIGNTSQVIQNGHNGILLDKEALEQLPDVLIHLLKDDEKRNRLGRAAREFAVNSLQTWPERIKMEVDVIEELVNKSRGKNNENRLPV